jgi:hypothetical protein
VNVIDEAEAEIADRLGFETPSELRALIRYHLERCYRYGRLDAGARFKKSNDQALATLHQIQQRHADLIRDRNELLRQLRNRKPDE